MLKKILLQFDPAQNEVDTHDTNSLRIFEFFIDYVFNTHILQG